MKEKDLKKAYDEVPESFHNRVTSTLDQIKNEQEVIQMKKYSKTSKVVMVCAVTAAVGAFAVAASATGFFGLIGRQVGQYGLNIKVESSVSENSDSSVASKTIEDAALKVDYVPEGYEKFPFNPRGIQFVEKSSISDGNLYGSKNNCFVVVYSAEDFDETIGNIKESSQAEFNGHKAIIMDGIAAENTNEMYYQAAIYFNEWGSIVRIVCPDRDELLKIAESTEIIDIAEYSSPDVITSEEIPETEDYSEYYEAEFDETNFKIVSADEPMTIEYDNGEVTGRYSVKIKSIEDRKDMNGLDKECFLNVDVKHDGNMLNYNKANIYFDENGNLKTPYERVEIDAGDGINTLNQEKKIEDDRHFYLISLDVTAEKTAIDKLVGIKTGIIKNQNDEWTYYNKGGAFEEIYYSDLKETADIKEGETVTLTYGIIVDDDAVKNSYLTFAGSNGSFCVKLDK